MNKHCYKCKTVKLRTEFYKDKSKSDGLEGLCKDCTRIKNKTWATQNPHKVYAKSLTRETRFKQRVAKWDTELTQLVTEEAGDLIKLRKEKLGIAYHLDHIIPIKGEKVSGLHVWNNLQMLTATENIKKGNKFNV